MDVQKLLRNPRFRLERDPAPDTSTVKQFQEHAPPNLPRTYVRFMVACSRARGKIPYDTGYIELPLDRVLDRNREHGIAQSRPASRSARTAGPAARDLSSRCPVRFGSPANAPSTQSLSPDHEQLRTGIVMMGGA
jgi:hypothetical protein